jgi:hypothetical protein
MEMRSIFRLGSHGDSYLVVKGTGCARLCKGKVYIARGKLVYTATLLVLKFLHPHSVFLSFKFLDTRGTFAESAEF